MVQGGEHFRFALKARDPIGVSRQRRRENLDGNLTLQPRVRRPVHLAHAAFADLAGDIVDADARTGSEGQTFVDYTGGAAALTGFLLSDAAGTIWRAATDSSADRDCSLPMRRRRLGG
jgi:hypothetical protein